MKHYTFDLSRIVLIAIAFLVYVGCKKNDSISDQTTDNNNVTPNVTNTILRQGVLVISATRLDLYIGESASLTVKTFDEKGDILNNSLPFQWQATGNSISVDKNGVVSALKIGNATITVSDGIHGNGYVSVNVLPSTQTVSNNAINISFNKLSLSLEENSQIEIPQFQLTNRKGSPVNEPVTFSFENKVGAEIINNKTLADKGLSDGFYEIKAKNSKNEIIGEISFVKLSNRRTDTFYNFKISSIPNVFTRYNITSTPVLIRVNKTWRGQGVVFNNWIETNPERIDIDVPKVVDRTDDGRLVSKYPGGANVTVGYKDKKISQYCYVGIDISGNWSGKIADKEHNFCFSPNPREIGYNLYSAWGPDLWDINLYLIYNLSLTDFNGTANISGLSTTALYNQVNYHTGMGRIVGVLEQKDYLFGNMIVGPPVGLINFKFYWQNDINSIKADNMLLTRGTGSCNLPQPPAGSSLAEILCNGSSKSWKSNECFFKEYSELYWNFKNDSTIVIEDESGDIITWKWGVLGNNSLIIRPLKLSNICDDGDTFTFNVSSYSPESLSFSSLVSYDNCRKEVDSTTTESAGCILGIVKKQ